jgi:hypothetical protein
VEGVNEGYRFFSTEVIRIVIPIVNQPANASAPVAPSPLVSEPLPTAPVIVHTVTRVATTIDTSGTSQEGEKSPSALTRLQEGAAEQAAGETAPTVRAEEVAEKESASPARQTSAQGPLAQADAGAGALNAAVMRVRAGNREHSVWGDFAEPGASSVPEVAQTGPASSPYTPQPRMTTVARRLAPPLPELVALVHLSSQAALALETGMAVDLVLLKQEVDTFFAHLAGHPETVERFRPYLRVAPWLALLGGAAAFEFARRWEKKSRRTTAEDEAVFGPLAFLPEDRQ